MLQEEFENRISKQFKCIKYNGTKATCEFKCNYCGTVFSVKGEKLLYTNYKCACQRVRKSAKKMFIEKLEKKYSELFDCSNLSYKDYKTKIKVKCNKYSNEIYITPTDLLKNGCYYCNKVKKEIFPKYYVYRLTFSDNSTYVGCHIQRKENDGYLCSSSYLKNHPNLTVINKEIIYVKSLEEMNFLETVWIMDDKSYSSKNVNFNLGNFAYGFKKCLTAWNNGLKLSQETCSKISLMESEPIICIETGELFKNGQGNPHMNEAATGLRKTSRGLHYRKISLKEKEKILKGDLEETLKLNKMFLIELYKEDKAYYCQEYNIGFESIEMLAKIMNENPTVIKNNLGKNLRGFTIFEVDYAELIYNDIKVIRPPTYNWKTRKVKCVETGKEYNSLKEAMEETGASHIIDCLNGSRNSSGGLHWEET